MTPREIFLYLMMSIMKDELMMALDMTRRTAVLELLRKEYCPSVTDDDWLSLAMEVEKNREDVVNSCRKLMSNDELHLIYVKLQERWSKRK